MNYSELLLKQIRDLNRELAQYAEPATPEDVCRHDELLQALAWYVHKLQVRVLPVSGSSAAGAADVGGWMQPGARARIAPAAQAGAR